MPLQGDDDVFEGSSAKFLSPSKAGPRRISSKQTINGRKSTSSLLASSNLAQSLEDSAGPGKHSLAHELAFALMPEPSAGSKLLQEEFGIEFDEGAEGIDEQADLANGHSESLASELNGHTVDVLDDQPQNFGTMSVAEDLGAHFSATDDTPRRSVKQQSVQDPMEVLSKDLEKTDKFLSQLRQLDSDSGHSSSLPSIEKLASDMIRHINETVRDREGQVRELLEYEREFRKISGEVNGDEVLGNLDELQEIEGLSYEASPVESGRPLGSRSLDTVQEEIPSHHRALSNEWELDPDVHRLGDEDTYDDEELASPSPTKDSFFQPPQVANTPTVPSTLSQLVHVRTLNASLVTSLTTISEHAQVNGAANADASRKIRSLKNMLSEWRTDWDSAERSRVKIERWEAGLPDDGTSSIRSSNAKRINGRLVVEEHLRAFEAAIANAAAQTQAIMARS